MKTKKRKWTIALVLIVIYFISHAFIHASTCWQCNIGVSLVFVTVLASVYVALISLGLLIFEKPKNKL